VFHQLPDQPAPDWYTTTLAMRVLREYLGYASPLPIWFHYSVVDGQERAFRVSFQINGHPLRPWFSNPVYAKVDPATIVRLFHLR
jgi:hypothetical protein